MILNSDKKDAELRLAELNATLNEARASLNKVAERAKLWGRLGSYAWEQVNAQYWQQRLDNVSVDLKKLEQSGGNLELAKNRWNTAKVHLQKIQENKGQLLMEKGSLGNDKKHAQEQVDKYQQLASTCMTDDVRTLLSERVGEVTLES